MCCVYCVCGGGQRLYLSVCINSRTHWPAVLLCRHVAAAASAAFCAVSDIFCHFRAVCCVVLCCVLCRLPDGSHCGLQEATEWPRPKCADVMWDWWLAETLKVRFCARIRCIMFLLLLQQHQLLLLILCAAQSVLRGAGTQHAYTPTQYSWLLHSEPDVLDLKEWIFNTEGHTYRVNGGIAAGHHHHHHQRATTSAPPPAPSVHSRIQRADAY